MVGALADLLQPWSDLYNSSVTVETIVLFGHLGGILVAGGFAVATDRAVLRVKGASLAVRAHVLKELDHIHRPVLVALGVVIVTGLAMLLSDVRTFLPSWVFWLKMGLFVALLANGLVLERAGHRLRAVFEGSGEDDPGRGWNRLRHAAVRSGALWGALLLAGVLLTAV